MINMAEAQKLQDDAKRMDRLILAIESLAAALEGSNTVQAARLNTAEAALVKLSPPELR